MHDIETRCLFCDKRIPAAKERQKFCNRSCYMKYRRENPLENNTLCWTCKNTNGNVCSWFSEKMKPVKGWTARLNPTADGISYFVTACPGYERMDEKNRQTKQR